MPSRARSAVLLALALAAGCGGHGAGDGAPGPGAASGALPAGVVAKVGPRLVPAANVAQIASAQGISERAALEVAVTDALLALGAAAGPEANRPEVRMGVTGILVRALLHQLWGEAVAQPISADELAAAAAQHWLDVDRPDGFRTVHALVQVDEKADDATRSRAHALAERIRAALGPTAEQTRSSSPPARAEAERLRFDANDTRDPAIAAFKRAVTALDAGGLGVRVEALPAVAADGRVIDYSAERGATFVPEFSAAAAALRERGEVSAIVQTSFGYHVIMLLERLPGRHASQGELTAELHDGILADRARRAHQRLLSQQRARTHVELASNVDALLAQVKAE
jgi:hypothetical protein